MEDQKEIKEEEKEIKNEKLINQEFNSENGVEEAEDIQEESEEIEEEYDEEDKEQDDSQEEEIIQVTDEELIPTKENFYFELNNSLLILLNNVSLSKEELIQEIIKEIKLNSKNSEEIGLYIYIHFIFRNSYEIFLNLSKNISHKDIFYFVDKNILVSFDMKNIMNYIIDNSLEFNDKEEKEQKVDNKNNNKIVFEFVKKRDKSR